MRTAPRQQQRLWHHGWIVGGWRQPGERVERIPAFTAEGMIAGADLPGRGS
jgi:hypothetical protein